MPKYAQEGDAIEGLKIYCQFKERPSKGIDKETGRDSYTITGNTASARIIGVWKYHK